MILVDSRAETFNFCTHSLDSLLKMLSLFLWILYLLSSLSLFLFSSKLFTKSKFWVSSFNFPSNRLFHQGFFFVFGSLLALTSSVTYAAAAYIVMLNSVRFRISIFLSTLLTLFTEHFTFAFGIPCNDFNWSFSYIQMQRVAQMVHFYHLVKLRHVSVPV